MRTVQTGPLIGLVAQIAVLGVLAATLGLDSAGWVTGIACGLIMAAALARGLARSGAAGLGPADWITLERGVLAGGIAALTITRPVPVTALVPVTVVALVLDAADGWVARRTGTVSPLGARFDMEVDAFLILVLSVYAARIDGWWILTIGLARYAFVVAGWLLPWMRGSLPPRYWRKVVAAVQGIVLTFAIAGFAPRPVTYVALLIALALLAESFGRDVRWLWFRGRDQATTTPGAALTPAAGHAELVARAEPVPAVGDAGPPRQPSRARVVAATITTVLACLLVWFALVAPNQLGKLTLSAFVRIPVEALVVVTIVLVLPARFRRYAAAAAGAVLGLLTVVKILDLGFFEALDRPFNPVTDWGNFGPAVGVLSDSIGHGRAITAVIVLGIVVTAILVFVTLSAVRLSRLAARHRTGSLRTAAVLAVVWLLCAVFGLRIVPGVPIASTSAAGLAAEQVREIRAGVTDQARFARSVAADRFRATPANDLLTGLRGRDVIVAFVESYGRVAVQDSSFSPQVDNVLNAGTARLGAAGFSARSAFLTSPTFGGISWLAHSTLQTGLWIDNQQRYNQVTTSNRFTLSDAFKRAGWRTVGDVPSDHQDWSVGRSLYHYDQIYDDRNVGYAGPSFSYASMPDQYILSAFQRLELAKPDHAPVMAEIDLVSTHTPWAPLPRMVGWAKVGDGTVFNRIAAEGQSPNAVWSDPDKVRAAYGQSVEYSLNTIVSFVQTYPDKNLVLIILGDHQPATIVSGQGATHDVPISMIAHDPAVLDRISSWGWQDGLLPSPAAPVWPMDAFRDRFLTAYGPQPSPVAH